VNWYCLHTKPLKETQVVNYCASHLGLETYYPRLRQQRTIRRQRKFVVGPLFPRYLFCRFDARISFRAVRYAPEVINVVSAGKAPAVVSDTLIEDLRRWASGENGVITLRPTLRVGDQVEIISGPLQGLPGIISGDCSERERVTVLLSILQCGAQLNVDRSQVRLIA
jgi:transcriptional antiterminator RfaH